MNFFYISPLRLTGVFLIFVILCIPHLLIRLTGGIIARSSGNYKKEKEVFSPETDSVTENITPASDRVVRVLVPEYFD